MFRPTFEVEVAEPEMLRPERVVVPKPELETFNHGAEVEPTQKEKSSPATEFTESLAAGVVEPIPNFPSAVNVVVAVLPNSSKLADKRVEEALPLNCCRAVHVFALERFRPIVLAVEPL